MGAGSSSLNDCITKYKSFGNEIIKILPFTTSEGKEGFLEMWTRDTEEGVQYLKNVELCKLLPQNLAPFPVTITPTAESIYEQIKNQIVANNRMGFPTQGGATKIVKRSRYEKRSISELRKLATGKKIKNAMTLSKAKLIEKLRQLNK